MVGHRLRGHFSQKIYVFLLRQILHCVFGLGSGLCHYSPHRLWNPLKRFFQAILS